MIHSGLFAALLSAPSAHAGSIMTAGVTGGPDSGAATPNVAAVMYNPGALGAVEGVQGMFDLQASFVRLEVTTTRNGGIDPNTGAAWKPAYASATVPNGIVGLAWRVIPDRLTLAFAAYDPFVGGGDYSETEKGKVPPYTGHQRYHIIQTTILTGALTPAVAVTVLKGVHIGGGVSYVMDSIKVKQNSDPIGSEGVRSDEIGTGVPAHPYALDTTLQGDASGHHLTWKAGIFIDRWKYAQVGASFQAGGTFQTSGTGSVTVPTDLSSTGEPITVPALVSVSLPLPPIARLYVNSQVNDKLKLGAGLDYQMWNVCCGEADGDIAIGLTNTDGGAIGPDNGVAISISKEQYGPRRLWNSASISQLGSYQATPKLWAGWRLMYNQNAVPDYAVSPSNLDFESVGASIGGRYLLGKHLELGLAYTKYLLVKREITTSAWDLRDGNTRFSPELPYKSSTNGTYQGVVDTVGLRVGAKF